jgi:dihydroflavonol-4-reductase
MRVAILGATGMLGHHTAAAAVSRGHELVVIHRASSKLEQIAGLRFENRVADFSDEAALTAALESVEVAINAAAYYPTLPRPWRDEVITATHAMRAFYRACRTARVPRAVYVGGSIALERRVDGGPADETCEYSAQPANKNPYLQVKWALDAQARSESRDKLAVVTAIPSMTFGEFDFGPTTGRFITDLANGQMPGYVAGLRNAVYAGDAGRGIVLTAEKGRAGERYLITGENTSMDDLMKIIATVASRPIPRKTPLFVAKAAAAWQTLIWRLRGGEPPRISSTAIAVMSAGQHLSGEKAAAELGYVPNVALLEAIHRAYDWFRSVGYIK